LRPRQRLRKSRGGIEIETLRLQFRLDPGAVNGLLVRHHHPPLDRATFDVGLHGVDGKALGRDRHIAAQPKRLLAAIGGVAAALQPGQQRLGIGRFDAERDLETVRPNVLRTGRH
jgi:hypothetical protein